MSPGGSTPYACPQPAELAAVICDGHDGAQAIPVAAWKCVLETLEHDRQPGSATEGDDPEIIERR